MPAELTLKLTNPRLSIQANNTERVTTKAQLILSLDTASQQESPIFPFTAPIGLLEEGDLKWYLESYYHWPVGLFKERAERIEQNFPKIGSQLLASFSQDDAAQAILQTWLTSEAQDLRFILSVYPDNSPASLTASSRLLAFPWELLSYQNQYLLAHQPDIRIHRMIGQASKTNYTAQNNKLRILAISPRPIAAGYIDHRVSLLPLLDAVEALGTQVELARITFASFEALQAELKQAQNEANPFHILHFDGHGVFHESTGKGALIFEHKDDKHKSLAESFSAIYADQLADLLKQYTIPLVFLEACQTAQSDTDPNASVAAALLQAGVSSVIAMSYSVLVETAKRFVEAFYQQIAQGKTIGTAVLHGQQALMKDSSRINIVGAGQLHLQDWFVPVLYQYHDQPLLAQSLQNQQQKPDQSKWSGLKDTPSYGFVGRSPELLQLERLLIQQPYAVIRGLGGIGKTTIAAELARWLLRIRRFDRCAFVSLEEYSHDRAVLDELGKQLVGKHYSVAEYGDDLDKAMQPIQRVLENERCLLVMDNMQSLLADSENSSDVLTLVK